MACSLNFNYFLDWHKLERSELFKRINKKLKENQWYTPVLDFAEETTAVNRVYIVFATVALLSLFLLFEYGTLLLTGCIGFLYPGYKTFEVLQHTDNAETARKWLVYWFLHSALNFAEIVLLFFYWIPAYWLIKCCFLFWCYAPLRRNGADIMYCHLLQPFFQKNREVIDNAINQMVRTAHSIYTEAEPLIPVPANNDLLKQN